MPAKRSSDDARDRDHESGVNWEGLSASAAKKAKKKGVPPSAASVPIKLQKEPAGEAHGGTAAPAGSKKKRKKHLGKKEREKLRLKAAKAQELADEEAGRLAAGGAAAAAAAASALGSADEHAGSAGNDKKKSRYTVFVGNLPYDATQQVRGCSHRTSTHSHVGSTCAHALTAIACKTRMCSSTSTHTCARWCSTCA